MQFQIQNPNRWWWQPLQLSRIVPSDWSDISPKVRLQCVRALVQGGDSIQNYKTKLKWLKKWLNLPRRWWYNMTDEDLSVLVEALDWMKLEPSETPIIQSFEHNRVVYHFPKAGLSNCAAVEFPIADDFLQKFIATGEKEYLVLLAATLCREAKNDPFSIEATGDIRRPLFSKNEAEARAERLNGVGDDILTLVMLYFVGCKLDIATNYGKYLFDNEGDTDTESDTSDIHFGWWGVFDSVARSGVFGNYEAVKQTNFINLCNHLVINSIEQKRLKKLLRTQNPNS